MAFVAVVLLRLILLLACLSPCCWAWGPVSHYFFAQQSLQAEYYDYSFKQGCDMPDSFYFTTFSEFNNCTIDDMYLHNPVTAGYFVLYARTLPRGNSTTFDPLSFALGFGGHMIADYVGFHSQGGILGSTVPNYITSFPIMTSLDAMALEVAQNSSLSSTSPPLNGSSPWATQEAAVFLVQAANWYRSTYDPSFIQFSVSDVLSCIQPWQATQQSLTQLAQFQLQTGYSRLAMQRSDPFQPANFSQASLDYGLSLRCVLWAIQFWNNAMAAVGAVPATAFNLTAAYVDSAWQKGLCTPTAAVL
jgi:hypothetical protein